MNSKPAANWSELPVEMRHECIKNLDFKSRMCMRAASKSDKQVVESAPKYHFDSMIIEWAEGYQLVECGSAGNMEIKYVKSSVGQAPCHFPFIEKGCQLALQLLKFADAENLIFLMELPAKDDAPKFLSEISNWAPFAFKSIYLDISSKEIASFFLQNCPKVEKIALSDMYMKTDGFTTTELMEYPSVVNAKKVHNRYEKAAEGVFLLVKKWIERGADYGTMLQVRATHPMPDIGMDSFDYPFYDLDVNQFYIKTDDRAKEIFMNFLFEPIKVLSFAVVSAREDLDDYKKDKEWAKDVESTAMTSITLKFNNFMTNETFRDNLRRAFRREPESQQNA